MYWFGSSRRQSVPSHFVGNYMWVCWGAHSSEMRLDTLCCFALSGLQLNSSRPQKKFGCQSRLV